MGTSKWGYGSADEWLHHPEPMTWRRFFYGTPHNVKAARDFARALLADTGHEEDVQTIITELGSNAVIHTRSGHKGGFFGVQISIDPADRARIAVSDMGGGGFPAIQAVLGGRHGQENGRGLLIVADLAAALGIHGTPGDGHTVWADLDPMTACRSADPEPTPNSRHAAPEAYPVHTAQVMP